MKLWAIALALTCFIAGPARAAWYEDNVPGYLRALATKSVNGNVPRGLNPDAHFITINPAEWYDSEQAAVSGYSWGKDPGRLVVGGAFRGYSEASPWAFGIATEALSGPTSNAHLIGAELAVISRNPNSVSQKWGLNIIFFDRATGPAGNVESGLGDNRYNENAKAVVIEATGRSDTGEYSGWQTGIQFGKTALDRTSTVGYATAMDVSPVQTAPNVPWYILTWQCGESKCGLRAELNALQIWTAIETPFPRLVRTL